MDKKIFKATRLFLAFVLSLSVLSYSQPNASSNISDHGKDAGFNSILDQDAGYGPKLPDGEDGEANLDAGKKLQMLYWIGAIAVGVVALIVLFNQAEDADTSWN